MIRFIFGLLLMFGAAGGLDDPAAPLLPLVIAAAVGMALMLWAVKDINKQPQMFTRRNF
jgi:hypothetical protein